jgi:hypothetical protein
VEALLQFSLCPGELNEQNKEVEFKEEAMMEILSVVAIAKLFDLYVDIDSLEKRKPVTYSSPDRISLRLFPQPRFKGSIHLYFLTFQMLV